MNFIYILLTSAHNEERFIKATIDSVASQTIHPLQWLIISDGSTDKTDEIIIKAASEYKYITYIRRNRGKYRSFGQKVFAINYAHTQILSDNYDFIGILDADITFSSDYFELLFKEFNKEPNLGIAGALIYEMGLNGPFPQSLSENSVAGAVQMYRRELYGVLGDFLPLEAGGEDAAREIMARQKGWGTRTISKLSAFHHGYNREGTRKVFKTRYRWGYMFYYLGYSPLFMLFRAIKRIKEYPYIIGSIGELIGYFFSFFLLRKKRLPISTIQFLRKEQRARIVSALRLKR